MASAFSLKRTASSRDVAVYAPSANAFYDATRVLPGAGGGGAEFQTTQMAERLAATGLRVAHIIYPVEREISTPPNLDLIQRDFYLGRGGPIAKAREAAAIWRSLVRADAGKIILRGYGLHLLVGALFGRLRNCRVVMSGSNDIDFQPERRNKSRISAAIYRRAIGSADLIVAQTGQQRTVASREFPRSRVELIKSFAEPADVSTEEPDGFLWAGRLVDYKRPLRYLDLARRLPEAHFRMVCVETSETPEGMLSAIREGADRLPNLDLLEPRPRAELLEVIERSHAIVLTSEFEGMPNVFLEAWIRGIPVATLGFDPDGLIAGGGMGIAAEEDFEAFVSGVLELWERPDTRERMGASGRDYVLSDHAPDVVAGRWFNLLGELR